MKYCYLNGKIMPENEAKVSIFDIGLLRGFGIYEALTIINGKVFMPDDHLARFRKSADFLKITIPATDEEIRHVMDELIIKNGFIRANIKFILTGGEAIGGIDYNRATPTFYIFTEEWKPIDEKNYTHGASVILHEHLREYPEFKTINYITAVPLQKKMKDAGALEALYTWRRQILECATSNFFIVANNKLLTPKDNILYGITRKVTIDLARKHGIRVEECNVSLEEVYGADECFITSSFKDVVPVVKVGNEVIGDGMVGEMTKKVISIFDEFTKNY
jgi:D-amino acid aminotransferase